MTATIALRQDLRLVARTAAAAATAAAKGIQTAQTPTPVDRIWDPLSHIDD